ncbi:MAG: MFS transporter [Bacteroidetes bacterium]|nr:MFS transporter [Bacteroidota bacterium]
MLSRTFSLYRNAYSGLSRSTWLLSIVMLVNRSGTMVIPFMTIYLTQPSMGYSIGQAGIVMGIFGAGAVCGGFIGGKLTDKFGFHPVQLTALIGGGVLFVVLGMVKSYPMICVITFLLSMVNDAFRPANSTAIAHYSKEENRTRSYSLNRLAINLGWAVGGALGGILASINYHLLFWTDGLTNIAAALLLKYFLTPVNDRGGPVKKEIASTESISALKDKGYLMFTGITILFAICFYQLFTTLPVYYKQSLHIKEFFIGLLMALNGVIITVFEMVLIFKLEGKRQNVLFIRDGFLLTGLSFLLLNIFPASALAAVFCMILVTFGEMLSMPFMNSFWISRTTASNRGQYAGLYTIAWSSAQVIGPSGGAQIVQHLGFRILWWIVGSLCIVTAFCVRLLKNHS